MGLLADKTKWVLFLASSSEPEDRHVSDLAFGIYCLENRGINPADIFIYIDGNNRGNIQKLISVGTNHQYNVKRSSDFFSDCDDNTHDNIVIFITGHGSMHGLDALPPIPPYRLLNRIKTTPDLDRAIVYMGQCYAGIFNYLAAGRQRRSDGKIDPEAIFMGATNLHESISSSTTENINGNDYTWVANLFLLNTFKWISNPFDVDGDGKNTVIDSYKYAGTSSNVMNMSIKMNSFVQSVMLHSQWSTAKTDYELDDQNQTKLLIYRAYEQQYLSALNINFVHQECWILNSVPAQQVEY
ncbi:hypothetical protein [Klebsiella pneumoniae]|uniref:hypothetical protein n=1 Tax=Klebsiella pneumoniae TaxID=573 RepID=UPI002552EE74|nr:hypothetical protein [Klebsiella pneumoniae]HEB5191757.1 hypothetical protein [Klebsiella pneumoniae]HEB5247874.1 hypothetical protein [Klebsiella pneumoniae]